MGPKKGKEVVDENSWRTSIEEQALNDPEWSVKVIMFEAAGSDQDRLYLSKFEMYAALEKRFVVKNICKTETIFMTNQLGGDKKVKDDSLRVFEEGQAFLKEKKDIPPDLLALIIKHLILKMKSEYLYIKRQKLEVKEGIKRESLTMIDKVEVRGTVVKPPDPEPEPVPQKSAKGKNKIESTVPSPIQPEEGKKYNTELRVRGEEWRDRVYVDDFPVDGPNIYVAVTNFTDPLLPGCLLKIGVPLSAIIQVRIDPGLIKVPSSLMRTTRRGQSQTELLYDKSLQYWEDLQQLRISKKTTDDFKNTAFAVFAPPYWNDEKLTGNPDIVYDELCYLMYDIQDLTRQHVHFLENMDIIHIPKDTIDNRYKNQYSQHIEDLPLECVTIYSVLDSVLQTISKLDLSEERSETSDAKLNTNQQSINTVISKVEKAQNLVNNVFKTLQHCDEDLKRFRITYGEEFEAYKEPIVINYGDGVKYNTFHLGNINLDQIVYSTLFGMPVNQLWEKLDQPVGAIEAKINFHVNVLLSCFEREDVETAELERLIHILACRKIFNNRSSLQRRNTEPNTIAEFKNIYLKRSILAEPFKRLTVVRSSSCPSITKCAEEIYEEFTEGELDDDDEAKKIKFLFDCPDLSELVSAAEIANAQPINHFIDNYEYFEDLRGICAFQTLLDAFNKYNCVDYKYCEVTDCIVMMFFNSHDNDRIAREEWRSHLPTPVCLQDFFDYILEEHYEWIQNEEKIYDEKMTSGLHPEGKDIGSHATKACINQVEVQTELLMEGSLKHQEIEELGEQTVDEGSRMTLTPPSTSQFSAKSKNTKSPVTSTPKSVRQSILTRRSESFEVEEKKPFSGYDLGDRRVEAFGKDAIFYSKDGTRVISRYCLMIPLNIEHTILSVVPGNSHNQFWIHRMAGETISQEESEACESFRLLTKDQVMVNIRKQVAQIPILPESSDSPSVFNEMKQTLTNQPLNNESNTDSHIFETKIYHSLYITWPNGLIIETVHKENSINVSHVKQQYLTSVLNLKEDNRCISLNGEVVIFKTSGEVHVLCPDGTFINIINCGKQPIVPEAPIPSETSSNKSKAKAKVGAKDKPKVSNKSGTEEVKPEIVKPPEYKLVIDEFNIIEASGLEQKYIDGDLKDIRKHLIRTATDYCLGEIYSRRMDGTNILLNKDGVQTVTFPDGTRIITFFVVEEHEIYPEWTEEEKEFLGMFDSIETDTIKSSKHSRISVSQNSFNGSTSNGSNKSKRNIPGPEEEVQEKQRTDGYISVLLVFTVEHKNFATVTVNKVTEQIEIESPNNSKVTIDKNICYNLELDSVTSAKFNGENLHIDYEACEKCSSSTGCDIKIRSENESSALAIHKPWLKMKDSFCKKIIVNEEGGISVVEGPCSEESLHREDTRMGSNDDATSETRPISKEYSFDSFYSHSKCGEVYAANNLRFFVLKRDLNCSELLHRDLVEEYKRACRWQPWCSISSYDTFGDHRQLVSMLTPIHLTETEKWLMDSRLAGKPQYLTYKDLKKDPGKGFYEWMRPYKRFEPTPLRPSNVLPPRLPRAFELRTLEQQWKENARNLLKGAKELSKAILRYRQVMESDSETILHVPIRDPRTELEKRTDQVLQALAHRVYEDLSRRLREDVQLRTKADITTKPEPVAEEDIATIGEGTSYELEQSEHECPTQREDQVVQEVEAASEMSPNLRRYWRCRAEELKEEMYHKQILREGTVPPYFETVLGGAIWWDLNEATSDATRKAERKKMRCVCADEQTSSKETKDGEVFDLHFV